MFSSTPEHTPKKKEFTFPRWSKSVRSDDITTKRPFFPTGATKTTVNDKQFALTSVCCRKPVSLGFAFGSLLLFPWLPLRYSTPQNLSVKTGLRAKEPEINLFSKWSQKVPFTSFLSAAFFSNPVSAAVLSSNFSRLPCEK